METDRSKSTSESLSTGQERLNRVYSTFLSFPPTEVDYEVIDPEKPDTQDNRKIVANKFIYRFPEGTTNSGYSDHVSGTYTLETGELNLYYAKGIFAERITLKRNPETNNVDLIKYQVYTKDILVEGGRFSMVPALMDSGVSIQPHLLAADSLIKDIEVEIAKNPKSFEIQAKMKKKEEAQRGLNELMERRRMAKQVAAVFREELARRKEAEKKKNGKPKGRRNGRRKVV